MKQAWMYMTKTCYDDKHLRSVFDTYFKIVSVDDWGIRSPVADIQTLRITVESDHIPEDQAGRQIFPIFEEIVPMVYSLKFE